MTSTTGTGERDPTQPAPAASQAGRIAAGVRRMFSPDHPLWPALLIALVYAAVVVFATGHHERWRDEIVPLSLARKMPSIFGIWRMLRHEGHPLVWYLCLRCAYFVFGSVDVLPVLSVVFAVAAVLLLLVRGPFPLWLKGLFVFGYMPLFEYSVVARPNGLAMLLLFGFCTLYLRRERPLVAMAVILAILANTTALAFIVAAALGVMVAIDALMASERPVWTRAGFLAVGVYVGGLAHAVASNLPDPSVLPLPLYHHDAATFASALVQAVTNPAGHSAALLWVPAPALWLWLFFLVLLRRPALLAFLTLTLIGFELVFILVYPASDRHIGYVLQVIMATLWLWQPWTPGDTSPAPGPLRRVETWARRLLLVPLTATLCFQAVLGVATVADDVRLDYSSSKRLASLIAADPRLDQAIVIGEPEDLTGSLPYYRDNRIFLPQENEFRDWLMVQVAGGRRNSCDLGELLATAQDLRTRYGTPVVLALGWQLDGPDVQHVYAGTFFEQTFTMTLASRTEFLARTEFLGRLRDAVFTDENYDVFVLR